MRGCLKERKAASYLIWRRPFADSGKTDPELIEHRVVSDRNALVDAADPLRPAYHILRLNRGQAVRFTIGFFLAVTAWVPIGFGQAQPTMILWASAILCASARSTFVHDPPRPWTGYGIYLGKGLVITAAHAVGSVARTKPSVHIAGLDLPAHAIKEGNFERVMLINGKGC